MTKIGRISSFGGPSDIGMSFQENTSFYEHQEADLRPDLFFSRGTDPRQGVAKRLRNLQAYYIALNVPLNIPRDTVHKSLWKLLNYKNGQFVLCHLVDRGPGAAGRLVDASDMVLTALRIKTDDEVEVSEWTGFGISFGLYGATLTA